MTNLILEHMDKKLTVGVNIFEEGGKLVYREEGLNISGNTILPENSNVGNTILPENLKFTDLSYDEKKVIENQLRGHLSEDEVEKLFQGKDNVYNFHFYDTKVISVDGRLININNKWRSTFKEL